MDRLFWGLFFVLLDFEINLGSATIGLLPDFVGFFLIMQGMQILMARSPCFEKGRHLAFGLTVLSVILYATDLMNGAVSARVGLWLLGLAGQIACLVLLYLVAAGIRQMERNHGWELNAQHLKLLWTIQAVMSTISYLLGWVPLVGVVCDLAAAVTAICFLAAMYDTRKRFAANQR